MGRREKPLDPDGGQVQRFASELRAMRAKAGRPTYRAMAARSAYAAATLAQAADGEKLPSLPVALAYVEACGGDIEEWKRRWEQVAQAQAAQPLADDAEPPYRGLARFQQGDREQFFGRDRLTADLLDLVRRRRFTAVVGPSGSGKSSLLRAGLLPALQHTEDPQLRPAALRILTPGSHPVRTHAHRLTPKDAAGDTVVVIDQFEETYTLCADLGERTQFLDLLLAARKPDSRLRVVIAVRADFLGRCAEYRDLTDALQEATLLVGPMSPAELREAIVKPAAGAGLIVERALTARITDEVVDEPGGLPLMSHALLETWRRRKGRALTETAYDAAGGLHGAIAQTAEGLYTRLSAEQAECARRILLRLITPGEGAQDTRRPVGRSELDTGDPVGTAAVLESLARARLITLDDDVVNLAHEALITAWARLRAWIEQDREWLRLRRQLTEAAGAWEDLDRDPGALYRGTRLAAAEEQAAQPERQADLTELERSFLTASTTIRDQERRTAARHTRRLRQFTTALSVLLTVSLGATYVANEQRGAAEEQRTVADNQRRDAQAQRRVAEKQRRVATGRALVAEAENLRTTQPQTSLRLSLAALHVHPAQAGQREARAGLVTTLQQTRFAGSSSGPSDPRGQDEPVLSGDGRTLATPRVDGVILSDITAPTKRRQLAHLAGAQSMAMAFSRDGRTLATGGYDGVTLWDLTDRTRPRQLATWGDSTRVEGVAFSPDGRTLAAVGYTSNYHDAADDLIGLWDIRDRTKPKQLAKRTSARMYDPNAVMFSPDGRTLITATEWLRGYKETTDPKERFHGSDGHPTGATLWDITDPRTPKELVRFNSWSGGIAFTPDSRTLALGQGRRTTLWDINSRTAPRRLARLDGHTDDVQAMTFSPDGRTLATAGFDATAILWDTSTPARPKKSAPLSGGHTDSVVAVAFSPDGRTLTTADRKRTNNTVTRWHVTPRALPTEVATLTGHTHAVEAVAFSPDSRTLATASFDDTVILWDMTDPARPTRRATLRGHTAPVWDIAFNPDGTTLVSGGKDGRTVLWDLRDRRHPRKSATLEGATPVRSVEFAPRGSTLVTTGGDLFGDGWAIIWDAKPRRPVTVRTFPNISTLGGATFTSDGKILALGPELWEVNDPSKPIHLTAEHNESTGQRPAFSPDAKTLGTVHTLGGTSLWDIRKPSRPQRTANLKETDKPNVIAFHPGGSLLAVAVNDGTTALWDIADPARSHRAKTLTGHADAVKDVAFSPHGRTLVTASDDATATVWDLGQLPTVVADTKATACKIASGGPTPHEWKQYVSELPYTRLCP
ncbi:hypothetical protein [Streptomyces sp. NPDC005407]|uniref:nSTAND1 domain-containing NTPase n=1 Tax=Streptomyces sp. NPDC005407 TaxID=3155340 RepID=UPI0033B3BE24